MSALRVHRFVKRRKSGWPGAMHVALLGGGDTIVHSPTFIDDATLAQVRALGTPRYLFAPNHFHWMGLPRYREIFPHAAPVASRRAIPRLTGKGNLGLSPIEDAELPRGVRWLVPEGTKSGEAWLVIDGPPETGPEWIVCDAFFHELGQMQGLEGMILRLGKISPGLCVGETFKRLCVSERARYVSWVVDALEREKPRRIHFSHGEPLEGDVVPALTEILRARLG